MLKGPWAVLSMPGFGSDSLKREAGLSSREPGELPQGKGGWLTRQGEQRERRSGAEHRVWGMEGETR